MNKKDGTSDVKQVAIFGLFAIFNYAVIAGLMILTSILTEAASAVGVTDFAKMLLLSLALITFVSAACIALFVVAVCVTALYNGVRRLRAVRRKKNDTP